MMWRLLLLVICFSSTFVRAAPLNSIYNFEDAEHIAIGESVTIHLTPGDVGQKDYLFHFPNGLQIAYGDLVALADFYELPEAPISLGKTEEEQKARFIISFRTLTIDQKAVNEAPKLIEAMHEIKKTIDDAVSKGVDPETAYEKIIPDIHRRYNCITGGGCSPKSWWLKQGRYLELANTDFDHFGKYAWEAYRIGHKIAIEVALQAYQEKNVHKLETAYAINAFASHFLSDLFSAGHMRTPRYELYTKVTPSTTGSILANYMHAEENKAGLHVHNKRGDHWYAAGDYAYLTTRNSTNRALIMLAMQNSADEIFFAYVYGVMPGDKVFEIIPEADETNNGSNIDLSPLFYWDGKSLMRRRAMENIYDRHWIANWWGWSTLAELSKERGLPREAQGKLAKVK